MVLSQQHLPQLIRYATGWVRRLHDELYPTATPLPEQLIPLFGPFFAASTLARIRLQFVPEIPNPDFYPALEAQGLPVPLDFRVMAGLTLIDTVLISQSQAVFSAPRLASLLFHEGVHVVQYEHLGLERFMTEYVLGWASAGQRYEGIPLEQQAYGLEARFAAEPSAPFSVLEAVAAAYPSSAPAA